MGQAYGTETGRRKACNSRRVWQNFQNKFRPQRQKTSRFQKSPQFLPENKNPLCYQDAPDSGSAGQGKNAKFYLGQVKHSGEPDTFFSSSSAGFFSMSNRSPLFNMPPNGNNGRQPPLLLIPSPVSMNPQELPQGPLGEAPLPNIPTKKLGPRRKPPPIDFSKIDGSHSFSPLSDSPHQQGLPLGLATNVNLTARIGEAVKNHTNQQRVPQNQQPHSLQRLKLKNIDDLTPEDWNRLANTQQITELAKLGEGNGGSVSKCQLRSGSPIFALKLINADPNPDVQKQIIRELQYNRLCSSPNIVKYYGTFMVEEQLMIGIAMEYMGGRSLDAIYRRVIEIDLLNRINEKVLGKIAESVLSGLNYLHKQRIIHRDIKPLNILLDKHGSVKICDFGVSGEVVNSLANTFVGTQYYMAPERIMGKPYTVSCDVWSLGLTLLEVALGRFPYHIESESSLGPIELLSLILEYEPHLEDVVEEDILWSDSFKNFIDYCLRKDPEQRPSPLQMLKHPWVVGQLQIKVNMDRFVKRLWGDQLD